MEFKRSLDTQDPKCFIDPENPGSKKHEFRQAGTGVPARSPE
jgi:hypothetical protein